MPARPDATAGQRPGAASDIVPASRAWRDLDAAVSFAVSSHELAVVRKSEPSSGVRRYDLLTFNDEEGTLIATAPAGFIEAGAPTARLAPVAEVALECRIGSFGNPALEAAFVRSVRAWRPKHAR